MRITKLPIPNMAKVRFVACEIGMHTDGRTLCSECPGTKSCCVFNVELSIRNSKFYKKNDSYGVKAHIGDEFTSEARAEALLDKILGTA